MHQLQSSYSSWKPLNFRTLISRPLKYLKLVLHVLEYPWLFLNKIKKFKVSESQWKQILPIPIHRIAIYQVDSIIHPLKINWFMFRQTKHNVLEMLTKCALSLLLCMYWTLCYAKLAWRLILINKSPWNFSGVLVSCTSLVRLINFKGDHRVWATTQGSHTQRR